MRHDNAPHLTLALSAPRGGEGTQAATLVRMAR